MESFRGGRCGRLSAYAELHAHSCYSFLDGASQPEELVLRAKELALPALALTDHDGLYGSMAFARAARDWGISPITGVELMVTSLLPGATDVTRFTRSDEAPRYHLTLLASSPRGYANLCRLITTAHRHARRSASGKGEPLLPGESLVEHAEGIVCLTGCRKGELSTLLSEGRHGEAKAVAARLAEWFEPGFVYVELQHNLAPGDTGRVRRLVGLAREVGLPVVATGNVHYHERSRHRLQDALVAIRHRTTLDASHALRRPNAEYHLRSLAEVQARFGELPEAIANTLRIAERCAGFDLSQDLGYRFPDFHSEGSAREQGAGSAHGQDEPNPRGASADEALARVCRDELARRYAAEPPEIREEAARRLEEELRLIALHRLAGFFLTYRDLLHLAIEVAEEVRGPSPARRAVGLPPGRGRGSSVGSIVCYLIGLSQVDPVKARLFLGRFLNEELHSVPDIDLDFARDIREVLLRRVIERYGPDHAALVTSFPTYKLRSAVRELGKVLGLPPADLDQLAKLSEWGSAADLAEQMARLPAFAERLTEPAWRQLIELAGQIDGLPRHVSQHVGGMIISSRPLVELVPLEPTRMSGRQVCQWDKDGCDDAGFIKVDFLALGMLSVVEEAIEQIHESQGQLVDLSRIPMDDAAVYESIRQADTMGVFQIESRAQMQMLPRTQPRNLEDLAVEVAIVRPGPIVGGAIHPYIERRTRQRENPDFRPEFDHPLLEPCLSETLGVILFQDQVLEVAIALAGFTAGQADSLRRAMSRKRSRQAMESLWRQFADGASRRGVPPEVAERVFKKLLAFSEFGFPKSHAFAFAILAYQSAWLRHHHPAAYCAALLNNQPTGFYPPHVFLRDAERHGVAILPPDVNESRAKSKATSAGNESRAKNEAPSGGEVRLGLFHIHGLGLSEALAIERARGEGLFSSLPDFVRRARAAGARLERDQLEALASVGALRSLGLDRRAALWQVEMLEADRAVRHRGQLVGVQLSLDAGPLPAADLPEAPAWERMLTDYRLMHFSLDHHPVGLLRASMAGDARERIWCSREVAEAEDGQRVSFVGLVVARQRPMTAKGFVFLLAEDEVGLLNVIVRPDLYDACRQTVRGEPLVRVEGLVQRREGTLNLLAQRIAPFAADGRQPRRGRSRQGNSSPGSSPPGREEARGQEGAERLRQIRRTPPPAHNFS